MSLRVVAVNGLRTAELGLTALKRELQLPLVVLSLARTAARTPTGGTYVVPLAASAAPSAGIAQRHDAMCTSHTHGTIRCATTRRVMHCCCDTSDRWGRQQPAEPCRRRAGHFQRLNAYHARRVCEQR